MRWIRRRHERQQLAHPWTAPLHGPFSTVMIHAPLAGDLAATRSSDANG